MERETVTIDGNQAAAQVAYQASEVIAIYPITPASPMGEHCDSWASGQMRNAFGSVPEVIEMQSEAGAAGALHGALQTGALGTTFTASQGLLLMIPNMYKIAGELTPCVIHVAARTLATHALSIFGDHSDVMAVRGAGWAMLCSASVQECQDMALISHAATLESRVPFLHFFDGFRTSHEVNKIHQVSSADIRAMADERSIRAHRARALTPDRPSLRGTAQNPDVFFQMREASNPYYNAVPKIVQETMDRFAKLTNRHYHLCAYAGHPEAERVIVLMGSGIGAVEEAAAALIDGGEKVGVMKIRLYRPFPVEQFVKCLPPTTRQIAVLDRVKEPGAVCDPLHLDVVAALEEGWKKHHRHFPRPAVVGGRYGLSSKEFTPQMAATVYRELTKDEPKNHFTVGIVDDVTHHSLDWKHVDVKRPQGVTQAVFYGLGSDGTVGANKNSVKIIGENTPLHAQGYFVYDSKKSGAVTVSHLRFGPKPIHSTYLISDADFVACHQFQLLFQLNVLDIAAEGATFLLNSPYDADETWERLPVEVQNAIIEKNLNFCVVDGYKVAQEAGMAGRINTVLQTCFFALSKVLAVDEAIDRIKEAIRYTYGKRGETVLQRNFAAVDGALASLHKVEVPSQAASPLRMRQPVPDEAPDFVQRVTAMMIAGKGDLLPVSAFPIDGTFPTATAKFEKRGIAQTIPIWDEEICIQCGLCALDCPHAAIRMKAYLPDALDEAPEGFKSLPWTGKDLPGHRMTIQVAPDDCTGCGLCVEVCPARSKESARHKAINMETRLDHLDVERECYDFFLDIEELDRSSVVVDTVKGSQLLQPLFEYSGACAGCGETPYLKLLSQLFGDRTIIANATGCSSIYGGNLPTTPWAQNNDGLGPAWSNSLFEDNAEFGLGMRLAIDQQHSQATALLLELSSVVGDTLVKELLEKEQPTEEWVRRRRDQVRVLKEKLREHDALAAKRLRNIADALAPRSVWIVGGDGWAYDIGFGGLDHAMATGRNVNILVLDTEVYSNTGGQASKATPRAAVAKFASAGRNVGKKDFGMIAMAYGNVYVAQIAIGANPKQTVKAFLEAASYPGPSVILAYSHCIAHGLDMSQGMDHQKLAVKTGYWPLYRFDPRLSRESSRPFQLDSHKPSAPFKTFAEKEARFAMLARTDPEHAQFLQALAQQDIDYRWKFYEQTAGLERLVSEVER